MHSLFYNFNGLKCVLKSIQQSTIAYHYFYKVILNNEETYKYDRVIHK